MAARNDPVTFCFHTGLWNPLRGPAAECIRQPHAAYQRAAAPSAADSACTSCPHRLPPPQPPFSRSPLPLHVLARPPPLLPPLLHQEGNLHFNRQSCKMRVCAQASSRKRTQLHKFPMNPPDNSSASENDMFFLFFFFWWESSLCANAVQHMHNTRTCIFLFYFIFTFCEKKQTGISEMSFFPALS